MGRKKKARYSGIGGQAVLEGIMMKNKDKYSVAIRTPDGDIDVTVEEYESFARSKSLTRIPFIRGVINFIDSLILGIRTLNYSASFYEEEQDTHKKDKILDRIFKDHAEKVLSTITVIISVVFAIGLFVLLPYYLSRLLDKVIVSDTVIAVLEGVLRVLIFVGYIILISCMKDIRRVFMYHGAEHKCINCIESGRELTVENVRRSSREHKRCGTSFLFFVVFLSVILFIFIRVEEPVARVAIRILLIPVIASIAYEIIRLAGRTNNICIRILSAPGMWLQRLTTREPDDTMIEVGIAAVEAVFDWKEYLGTDSDEL
ncbi:MAG: DUF1385 domain-containing protein [Lachnospiraceae bacterium]|nr:DUF1385 domain-containing protein [Lachnospiraceae bacterium]